MTKSVELVENTAGNSLIMSALSEERISFQTGLGQEAGRGTESVGKGTVKDVSVSKLKSIVLIGET